MVLTNLLLLNAGIGVVTMLGGLIVLYPIDSGDKLSTLFLLVLGMYMLSMIVFGMLLKNRESIWFQPVSRLTGAIITNIVVISWLSAVCMMVGLLVHKKPIGTVTFVFALLFFVGIGSGWWLRRRFWKYSLLPYGIGFVVALASVMATMIGFRL